MPGKQVRFDETIPPELLELQERTQHFTATGHWEISTALTTHHLLSVISIANTLMSMNSATFIPEQEKRRKLMRRVENTFIYLYTVCAPINCISVYTLV